MIEIRRILCPVDFSEASRHAIEHAVVMAGWYGSRITALHVFTPVLLPAPPTLPEDVSGAILPTQADRRQFEEQLRGWMAPAKAAGLETDVVLHTGVAAACIVEQAMSLPADLIVMGTHGRGGFERLVLGSVTEKVLRKANCPVLTVPPPSVAASKLPFKRLLCPVDFSDSSMAALRFAFSIAQEADARLTILHVAEWPNDELAAKPMFDVRGWETDTRHRLEALISDDVRRWCAPEPKLVHGKPYRQILDTAVAEKVDLIVIGVHGRNPLGLMFFGSTTNQVVRHASCPVLTLRE